MSLDYSRLLSLFIELAGNLRSYRWSCNAATANNSRKQLCYVQISDLKWIAVWCMEYSVLFGQLNFTGSEAGTETGLESETGSTTTLEPTTTTTTTTPTPEPAGFKKVGNVSRL